MNKEVIFVINKLYGGGAERVINLISNYFAEVGIQTTICTYSNIKKSYIINEKINYREIYSDNRFKTIKKISRILQLRRVFKENPNATIIGFEYFINMQVIVASLFLKNRVIVSERNDPNILNDRIIIKKLRALLYKYTDILVCQTKDAKEYFPRKIQKKSTIIPNPIMPNLPKRFTGVRKKEIVTFCRIEKQKNLKLMIDAFNLLSKDYPEYTLSIYGDGSKKQELIEYTNKIELSDKVKFYGFTDNIHDKITDKAMFVSSSDYEGISNSMIESMAIGLPCIVTDCPCGGARSIIENRVNGLLVPVGDVKSLYQGMKLVIKDEKLAINLSINAEKVKEKLKQETICREWEKLI